jgi:DNA-binding transcriptional LysR family regulator
MFPRDHVPTIHDRLVDLCQRVGGFRPTVGVDALQYPTMLGLVAAGYGVALVPASMRRLRLDGVGFLPLREAQLDTRLAIAHRVGDRAPQVARFVGLARSAVAGSHLLDVP